MHQTSKESPPDFCSLAQAIVQAGCDKLDMPTGIVSRIDNSFYRIVALQTPLKGIQPEMLFHLGETICALVVRSGKAVFQPDVTANPDHYKHPAYVRYPLRSYIGAPIFGDGNVVGTLNFTSEEPRSQFRQDEIEWVEMLAESLTNCPGPFN